MVLSTQTYFPVFLAAPNTPDTYYYNTTLCCGLVYLCMIYFV